jgi:ParB family chromosome partitioning protein
MNELQPAVIEGEQRGKPLLVPIERVVAGRGQPRRRFDEEQLDELAASIRENGILQPLVVVPLNGSYELVAGERRLRAAGRAGLDKVPVVFREVTRDGEMLELALVENLQREDLGPLERARAYEKLQSAHGLAQEEIARRVGKSRVAIANTLRLLALPQPVLEGIEQGLLTEGHARALLALPTAASQIDTMKVVVRRQLSVRETEELVRERTAGATSRNPERPSRAPGPLEADLSRKLGTKVRVRGGNKKGRIEIEYYSQEELTRLIDLLSSRAAV